MIIKLDFKGKYELYKDTFYELVESRVADIRMISKSLLKYCELFYKPSVANADYILINIPDEIYDKYKPYINEVLDDLDIQSNLISDVVMTKYRRELDDFSK